jgi:hypothetical protein
LFLIALGVRWVGIDWGLPNAFHHYSYHPDEWLLLAVSYGNLNPYAGDWLPHFYNYGSLPLYLWSIWLHWLGAVGLLPALPDSPDPVRMAAWRAAAHFWARVLVALMGAGTAVVVARTTARVAGERAGRIAGLAMALAPALVVHARFQTVDVPTTFFVSLALWCAVALFHSPRPVRTLLWGAFWAGCAAGCKYNAGLVLLAPLVSAWLYGRQSGWEWQRRLIASAGAVGIAGATFLLVCPGAWAEPQAFWRDFRYELLHVQRGTRRNFHANGRRLAVPYLSEPCGGLWWVAAVGQPDGMAVGRAAPSRDGGGVGRRARLFSADWQCRSALPALHLSPVSNAGDGVGLAGYRGLLSALALG